MSSSAVKSANYTSSGAPELPPAPPINVAASKGLYTDKIRITWDAVSDATSYEVWRQGSAGFELPAMIAENLTETSYDDTAITANTTYYYKLKAKNNQGASEFSEMDAGFIFSSDFAGNLDIEINNLPDRVVNLRRGQPLSLSINLTLNRDVAIDADWWMVAETPFGLYCLDASVNQWNQTSLANITPSYQGSLFSFFAPYEVLNVNTIMLQAGVYTFYFGVDTLMNGNLDANVLCYDATTLILSD